MLLRICVSIVYLKQVTTTTEKGKHIGERTQQLKRGD
jgi:hypothetical protein